MKAAPVIPKIPLQELKLNTDANPWFCSKPIDPVASNINLALIFFEKILKSFIGSNKALLVSVGQLITQSYLGNFLSLYISLQSTLQV